MTVNNSTFLIIGFVFAILGLSQRSLAFGIIGLTFMILAFGPEEEE